MLKLYCPLNLAYGVISCIEVLNLDIVKYVISSVYRFYYLCFSARKCILSESMPGTAWNIGEQSRQ